MRVTDLVWLRRDLRRGDLPTLAAAAAAGNPVAVVFVVDPQFWDAAAGTPRRSWLAVNLQALRAGYGGCLTVRHGDPGHVLPALAAELGVRRVHVSAETEPQGAERDRRVAAVLQERGVELIRTGSPYAVTPGRVLRGGRAYRVFTPFSKAWLDHGWRGPAQEPADLRLAPDHSDPAAWRLLDEASTACAIALPAAGEEAALERWAEFLEDGLVRYGSDRNRPDLDATSRLSPYLKLGVVHPRTLLRDLEARGGPGAYRLRTELAWREFYADVLFHEPHSEWADLTPALRDMEYDEEPERVEAWRRGQTGYPIVDAGMRQLLAEGWMHNRVRMIVASFLVKHLHTRWQVGAEHFLQHLIDADLASNQHGWQWVAGTGTDAAPYFRVFNPVLQGQKFDPRGDYVRRWVPELATILGEAVHEPWSLPAAARGGYPDRIVDLRAERAEALARLSASKAGRS